MGHALNSSAACDMANAMALEKAKLGDGAKIVEVRRKAWNSYDLAYAIKGADGTRKDVVVTNAALKRRLASKPKDYPLEVENIGSDVYTLMSRGHHDVHEFMKKVREEGYDWPLGMPRHIWFRTVPDRSGEFSHRYVEASKGDRGAFPVTYTSEAWGKDSYEQLAAAN